MKPRPRRKHCLFMSNDPAAHPVHVVRSEDIGAFYSWMVTTEAGIVNLLFKRVGRRKTEAIGDHVRWEFHNANNIDLEAQMARTIRACLGEGEP